LQYFHVRLCSFWGPKRTIHRVYVTETDFLFIHLDVATLHPEDYAHEVPAVTGGGAIPALIGAAVSKYVATVARDRLDRLTKSLDAADEDVLREFIEGDQNSFILSFQEIQDVRIERKTVWSSLLCRDLLAYLTWSSASRGQESFALIAPHEMVTVAEEAKRIFGEIECDLSWRAF
jgi:hypothetical protein